MRNAAYLVFCCLCLTLSACQRHGSYHDLETYVTQLDQAAEKKQNAQKISMPTLPTPVTYQKAGFRSPFDEYEVIAHSTTNVSTSSPINHYPLNLLAFVGVVNDNHQLSAYIMTPDDKLYQVRIGDSLGDHDGRIIQITGNEVQISEGTGTAGKPGTQRIVTLQLKDETSNGAH